MTLHLAIHDGRETAPTLPYAGCPHVLVVGFRCECAPDYDLLVSGFKGRERIEDDGTRVVSEVGCTRCKGSVGVLTVTFSTLFGAEEDRRVLHGRCRVY